MLERNAVVLGDGTDADMFALAADELEAAVQVFHIRAGRIRDQRGFIVERVEEGDQAQLVAAMLRQFYGGESGEAVPRQVLVSHEPDDPEGMRAWLSDHRGSNVDVRSPQRGDKKS